MLFLDTGMRLAELTSLGVDDVDFEQEVALVSVLGGWRSSSSPRCLWPSASRSPGSSLVSAPGCRSPRVLVRYALPAAVALIGFSVTAALVLVGLAVVLVTRWRPLVDAVRSPRAVVVGRALSVGVIAAGLPNALSAVVDIASQ